jgi:hypothetical protein
METEGLYMYRPTTKAMSEVDVSGPNLCRDSERVSHHHNQNTCQPRTECTKWIVVWILTGRIVAQRGLPSSWIELLDSGVEL